MGDVQVAQAVFHYQQPRNAGQHTTADFHGTQMLGHRNAAVADFGWMRVKGYLAWLMWVFLHVYKLIGFRNRLSVMTQWAFAYVTYQRSVRLITQPEQESR